jgi:hypothetical protein
MTKLLATATLVLSVLASSTTFAAEKTLTLAVGNMFCDACPALLARSSVAAFCCAIPLLAVVFGAVGLIA